jgi:hypothetical protein
MAPVLRGETQDVTRAASKEEKMGEESNPELAPGEPDLEAWLCREVGATGEVQAIYGGLEITIIQESAFPWSGVIRRLLQSDHAIWLEEREGQLVIATESSVD